MIDRVLVARARWDLLGAPIGLLSFATVAWTTTLSTAIVVAGIAMVLLGLVVVARWPETGFEPAVAGRRWRASASILRRGLSPARADQVVMIVIVATLLVNGSAEAFGRLYERRLVNLGIPMRPDPIVWFALVGLVGVALGATMLRIVETRIDGTGVARRTYALSCIIGVVGLVLFAHAPNIATGVAGSLLVSGIAQPVIRAAGVVWVNRRTTSAVRATVHSLLSQAENAGEVVLGLTLAAVARAASTTTALMGSAILLAFAGAIVAAARESKKRHPSRAPETDHGHAV